MLLSNRTPRAAAGATVLVVQGEPSNPAHLRANMPTDVAVTTPVEQSLAKLQELARVCWRKRRVRRRREG
ncbi:XVIPCD domain-containing protein [Xanthomonas floridensis]|uniref:DUF6696 domain-containing protein n=1 Tax=Xanthomonas floridensis TaxID=1843580 RepID=A0ABU5PUE2_9XANT|nr:XVIPCD domain-containing protein [Xanthomonas floridensis]MEA5123223.1 DUF6696 domain-containing protein [Xanthomonas floridensis]MEA5130751.1 DUF6696 domain-containing protein [Xanthomonas floridensis]